MNGRTRTSVRLATAAGALALAACASGSFDLPFLERPLPLAPVEGLESAELASEAHGALLVARDDGPIEVLELPGLVRRDHATQGEVVALCGPAKDGRFAYVTRDEEDVLRLRRAGLDGGDRHVMRLARAPSALSIAADGARLAALFPFDEGDPRSRGDVLRELAWIDLDSGELFATGQPAWNAPPAWVGPGQIAFVSANEDGTRVARVFDFAAHAAGGALGAADSVLCLVEGETLLTAARDEDGRMQLARVSLDGSKSEVLAVRGVLVPLALLDDGGLRGGGLLVSYSAPTLGAPTGVEWGAFSGNVALGTIKLHRLSDGAFYTIEPRASPRRLWSAGG